MALSPLATVGEKVLKEKATKFLFVCLVNEGERQPGLLPIS